MAFELQPTLQGELVELRPLRQDDFDRLYAVASDPLIWEQHPAHDRFKENDFREFFREALDSGGALIAIDRRTGHVVGSSRFHGYDPVRREIEIGWTFLARSRWGGAFNGEMKRLMLRHAFRFVDTVVFLVGPENVRSQRAVEKIGGVRAGTRPNTIGRESILYEITAASFSSQRTLKRRLFFFATFHCAEGRADEFVRAASAVVNASRAEPGCIRIDAFRSRDDDRLFFIHSVWNDASSFDIHASLPHTQAFLTAVAPLLDRPRETFRTTMVA